MTNLCKTTLHTRHNRLFAIATGIFIGSVGGSVLLFPSSHLQHVPTIDASIPTITIVGKRLPKAEAMNTASSADAVSVAKIWAAPAKTAIANAM